MATVLSADQALRELVAGNQRFFVGKPAHPHAAGAYRRETARSQSPLAVVLACSDSRVPPELIFDQGLGDLFVVRTAGNVVDDVVLGSLEFAAEHLHTPLLVVLGHARCAAVTAAAQGARPGNHFAAVLAALEPAVSRARSRPGDPATNAIKANIAMLVAQLRVAPPVLSQCVAAGELKVAGACYDLESGAVSFLPG